MDRLPEKTAQYMLSGVRRHITGQGGGIAIEHLLQHKDYLVMSVQ